MAVVKHALIGGGVLLLSAALGAPGASGEWTESSGVSVSQVENVYVNVNLNANGNVSVNVNENVHVHVSENEHVNEDVKTKKRDR